MRRFIAVGVLTTLFCFTGERASAFSLAGPLPPWQTANLGFQNVPDINTLVGAAGPMNINEEYRWNIPEIHYGFTAGFLSFFGQGGVDSVEEAVDLLNDIPALDGVDLNDYPTQSGRMNLRAAALGLTDIKSYVLSLLVQGRGLADPTRYANVIRNRWIENTITNYRVIKRNFDPETLRPSSYINGTLYNYIIQDPVPPQNYAWALNFPVDPLERILPRTLPVAGRDLASLPAGYFWTTLTRDDIGGLKHIYRSSNLNTENALADVAGSGGGGLAGGQVGFPGGGDNFDFPVNGIGGVGGGVYDFPFDTATNNVAGGVGGAQGVNQGVGGIGGAAAGGNFINPAVRGGVNRIRMVRADFDSLLGAFFNPLTVRFSETVLTNNRPRSQSLTRTLTQPDIIFDAADLQGGEATTAFTRHNVSGAGGWNNSDALDGITGDDLGPGVIVPPFTITLNTVGPTFLNLQSSNQFFLQEGSLSTQSFFTWASFDGSTNDPVVYPVGSSILEVERQVRR